jgi:hypothetical protein
MWVFVHVTFHFIVFSVMIFTVLLGSGFQWQTFPFLWVPELSLASATSFCNSLDRSVDSRLGLYSDWLTLWLPGWGRLTPTSYSSSCRLRTLLFANGSWSVLYSLGVDPTKTPLPTVILLINDIALSTDHVENTTSHSYSTVAFMSVGVTTWLLLSHSLATTVSAGFTVLAVSICTIVYYLIWGPGRNLYLW